MFSVNLSVSHVFVSDRLPLSIKESLFPFFLLTDFKLSNLEQKEKLTHKLPLHLSSRFLGRLLLFASKNFSTMTSPSKIPPPVQNPLTSSPPPSNSPHRTDSIDDLLNLEWVDSEEDSPPRKEKRNREEGVLFDVDAPSQRRRLDSG